MVGRVRALWIGTAATLATPVAAQTSPPPAPGVPATVTGAKIYTPADFTRFAPRTAFDMLRQVPGFPIPQAGDADERRGLGQASVNVLINGQRLTGKSTDAVTELGRIAASDVVRIEIADGATLDVPGLTGQVANIVTAARGGVGGTFAWRPQFRAERTEPRLLTGSASLSGKLGGVDYTLAIENQGVRNGNAGDELVFTPDGVVLDRRYEVLTFSTEQPKLSASLRRNGSDGSIVNLNGSIELFHSDVTEVSLRSGPGQVNRDRRLREREREWNYEIGGDYERSLGDGRMKLVALRRFEHSPFSQSLTVDFADARPQSGDRFTQTADERETIARGEYRWQAGGADWQMSLEGALNTLDIENRLFAQDAAGVFQPLPLANASATVKEKRAEAVLSQGRPLSSTLTVQASAGAEVSEIGQQGASGVTRRFLRPKGSVALAWKPSSRLDISGRVERAVGQLNFFDFVASGNVSAGTSNAGNVNLVPQQSWEAEAQAVRTLGAWGTVTARGYARLITDIVDIVPIGDDGQAPGNLDRATLYGAQVKASVNFDPVGLKGAKLDLDMQLQTSALTDPVTGATRAINDSMRNRIVAGFRHDVPGSDWAYGTAFERVSQSPGHRLDQQLRFSNEPGNLGIFIEHKDVFGLTVRGGVDNLLETNEGLDREFYDRRRSGRLLFTESRDRFYGPVFSFALTGKV